MAKPGYVYMLHAEGTRFVKIGKTINLVARFKSLQRGAPFPLRLLSATLVKDMDAAQDALLHQYGAYKTRGEWFEFPETYFHQWPSTTAVPSTPAPARAGAMMQHTLKKQILEMFQRHSTLRLSQILQGLSLSGRQATDRIRQQLHRLAQTGELTRVHSGVYRLGSMTHRPETSAQDSPYTFDFSKAISARDLMKGVH